jgi:hypothetical protein
MAEQVYKISIVLRPSGEKTCTIATRTDGGRILRSGGSFTSPAGLAQVVREHREDVDGYVFTMMDRAHELAMNAARAQESELTTRSSSDGN